MKNSIKNLLDFLLGEVHITLTPSSPDRSIKTFSFRRIVPVITIILVITTIVSLGVLFKHYQANYYIADNKLQKLKGVQDENQNLKTELVTLTRDTEELRQALVSLKKYNNDIREMINVSKTEKDNKTDDKEMEIRTILSYNDNLFQQGIPMGGGDFRLHYQDTKSLINNMQQNINTITQEIPEQRAHLNNLQKNAKKHNAKLAATPSIWPLADKGKGYISSNYGWRNDPATSEREFHEALDIAVWYNTPVLSTANGKITYAGWSSGYGWTVKIDHGFGFKTLYAHLNRIKVKKGQQVNRGEVIAYSGNSGRSTGPHLHYEVKVDNIPKNPLEYIGR